MSKLFKFVYGSILTLLTSLFIYVMATEYEGMDSGLMVSFSSLAALVLIFAGVLINKDKFPEAPLIIISSLILFIIVCTGAYYTAVISGSLFSVIAMVTVLEFLTVTTIQIETNGCK